jgi:hypothetical protein
LLGRAQGEDGDVIDSALYNLEGVWENDGYVVTSKNDIDKVISFYIEQEMYKAKDGNFLLVLKDNNKDSRNGKEHYCKNN